MTDGNEHGVAADRDADAAAAGDAGDLIGRLAQLAPAPADAAGVVAVAYAAGRRDGAAARSASLVRWRCAAGVLLAATVALSAKTLAPVARPAPAGSPARLVQDHPPAEAPRDARPALPRDPWAEPDAPLRVLPGSYAALRAAAAADGLFLGPREPVGGPGPLRDERPMTARGAV